MQLILAFGIGILSASGIWLVLRPRSFQVIVGLCLISYAVNLFIFVMARPIRNAAPIIDSSLKFGNPSNYTDPVPQALVLTAIVISFATTALFLVLLLVSRGITGSDHVDGQEKK